MACNFRQFCAKEIKNSLWWLSRESAPFDIKRHANRIREATSALEWYCLAKKKNRKLVEGMSEMYPMIVAMYKMHVESKKTEKQKSIWIN